MESPLRSRRPAAGAVTVKCRVFCSVSAPIGTEVRGVTRTAARFVHPSWSPSPLSRRSSAASSFVISSALIAAAV
jgi:hypothetical protein